MGLRDKLRRVEELAAGRLGSFELEDGTVYRYGPEALKEAFYNWYARVEAEIDGKPDPGAHPLVENLRQAKGGELERVMREEETLVQMFLVEDAAFRGESERTGNHENATRG